MSKAVDDAVKSVIEKERSVLEGRSEGADKALRDEIQKDLDSGIWQDVNKELSKQQTYLDPRQAPELVIFTHVDQNRESSQASASSKHEPGVIVQEAGPSNSTVIDGFAVSGRSYETWMGKNVWSKLGITEDGNDWFNKTISSPLGLGPTKHSTVAAFMGTETSRLHGSVDESFPIAGASGIAGRDPIQVLAPLIKSMKR